MTTIEQEVLEAAAKIVSDFGSHDKDAYFSNFGEDATFVFYTHPVRLESRADYEQLWNSWESEDGFKVHGCKSSKKLVSIFGESFAIFSHDVESTVELAGEKTTVFEKETIVFEKRASEWVAVHEHLSPAIGN
jgi:hypothetical protein